MVICRKNGPLVFFYLKVKLYEQEMMMMMKALQLLCWQETHNTHLEHDNMKMKIYFKIHWSFKVLTFEFAREIHKITHTKPEKYLICFFLCYVINLFFQTFIGLPKKLYRYIEFWKFYNSS